MLQFRSVNATERLKRADLKNHIITEVFHRTVHVAATETQQVGIARMCAHAHAMFHGDYNSAVHHRWISGMPGAGDIGRADVLNDLFIHAQLVGPKAFTHIAIEINFFHQVSPFRKKGFETQGRRSWRRPI